MNKLIVTFAECKKKIDHLKVENGLDIADERAIAIIHMKNSYGLDLAQATGQSATNSDYGFDAWHYDSNGLLIVYKSCFTRYPAHAASGFISLKKASDWIAEVILKNRYEMNPPNDPCLYNLYKIMRENGEALKRIHFELITPFQKEEIESNKTDIEFRQYLKKSQLNRAKDIQLSLGINQYSLEEVIEKGAAYYVDIYGTPRIAVDHDTFLDLTLVSLHSLVELYRQRGGLLFEKNIRLSLKDFKRAKDRLVTPMEGTLSKICDGKLPGEMFTFYHGGVTLAVNGTSDQGNRLSLDSPSVINGCQTITIANGFLGRIEQEKHEKRLERFRNIKVVAKIVVGASADELREITNANNRHNAIDNWQLYSNSPVHVAIELALKTHGIFYERQEGRFESMHEKKSFLEEYFRTNKTYISVQQLGQIIALCKRHLNWAAKKSEIFTRTENHDKIFDDTTSSHTEDIIFVFNLYKAMDRAIEKYLHRPSYQTDAVSGIFRRPMVKTHIYYIGCLYFYQKENKKRIRKTFFDILYKRAHPDLVSEVESSYLLRVMSKIKEWYVKEYGAPKQTDDKLAEVNLSKLKEHMEALAQELGVDLTGNIPFVNSIDWSSYYETDRLSSIEDLLSN